MIICTVPLKYIEKFDDLLQGLFYNVEDISLPNIVKLDCRVFLKVEKVSSLNNLPHACIIVSSKTPVLVRANESNPTVGIWDGTYSKKLLLEEICTYVALDRKYRYTHKIVKSDKYFYYGFKNLDELRIKPPRGIITSSPVRAALSGILLSERERRPKLMQELSQKTHMTKAQIELARANILLLQEAAGWK